MAAVKGTLFVISAPSGAGKTTLVNALVAAVPNLVVSVSHTTRFPRPYEQEGKHYYFVDKKTFKEMLEQHLFIEHAIVFNHYYGTSSAWVEEKLDEGFDVILEIDWQGAEQVRRLFVNCVSVFILPPSKQVLLQRLEGRASDNEHEIAKRMALANQEISQFQSFDYLVVNDVFEQAVTDLKSIVLAQRLLRSQQEARHHALLQELLS